jgi:ketosteroid isomerase-like protein
MRLTDVTEHTDEVLVDCDLAVHTGTFSEALQPSTGAAIVERGRYMFVWRRQRGGGWKIARGISTDLPALAAH